MFPKQYTSKAEALAERDALMGWDNPRIIEWGEDDEPPSWSVQGFMHGRVYTMCDDGQMRDF